MSLVLRQGLNADRLAITFEQGELVWTTDTQQIYVGDGITSGGLNLSSGLHNHDSDYYQQGIVDTLLLAKLNVTDFNLQFNAHTGNAGIHRQINDTGITLTDLWSASKIIASLLLKADATHNHNSLYYTKVEVDALLPNDEFVKVNATDTASGYLQDKVASGNGVTAFINTVDFPDNRVQLIADVWIENINGIPMPVFISSAKGKTLSVTMATFTWSEARLTNNDWYQIGTANNTDTGHVMPFDGTIVGMTMHCENGHGIPSDLDMYLATAGTTTTLYTINAPNEHVYTDSSLNIDFVAGEKIRLRNVGDTIEDTVVTLLVQWRL